MFSIIICTYNRDKYLFSTLERVAKCEYNSSMYEIVLINNNSTDNTEKECERFAKNYPLVPFRYFVETQQGLSYARNRGMAESKGDWLVFLDDDAFVCDKYLQKLEAQLTAYPDAIGFGGRIDPYYEDGVEPKWMSKWTYTWVSAINKGNSVVPFTKDYPIGANMGIDATFARKIGTFNVNLGRTGNNLMGGEEKDFFNRLKSISDKIYYFPNVQVEHCIPPKRLTKDFIARLGKGVGISERQRTQDISHKEYIKRCIIELIKWCGTLVILLGYAISGKPQKGTILVYFRRQVSRGLFFNNTQP